MENVQIREAVSSDAPAIVEFQMEMALESEGIELNKLVLTSGVQAVFNDPGKGRYYVCEVNEKVVASLMTTFEWSDWRNGMVLWIQSVYVSPDYRKTGVFRKMYLYLKTMVEASDYYRGIRLYVDNNNLPALEVYKAIGMNGEHYRVFEWMKI